MAWSFRDHDALPLLMNRCVNFRVSDNWFKTIFVCMTLMTLCGGWGNKLNIFPFDMTTQHPGPALTRIHTIDLTLGHVFFGQLVTETTKNKQNPFAISKGISGMRSSLPTQSWEGRSFLCKNTSLEKIKNKLLYYRRFTPKRLNYGFGDKALGGFYACLLMYVHVTKHPQLPYDSGIGGLNLSSHQSSHAPQMSVCNVCQSCQNMLFVGSNDIFLVCQSHIYLEMEVTWYV